MDFLIDPIALLFLAGGIVMLYGIVRVLMNPLDLDEPPPEDEKTTEEAEPPTPGSGGRRAA